MTKILIGMLVRNREKVLNDTLWQLMKLDYDTKFIGCYFVVNDSTDNSLSIIRSFRSAYQNHFRYIDIDEITLGTPSDLRSRLHICDEKPFAFNRQPIYKALCTLHNKLLDKLQADVAANYMMVVDSDTWLKPQALQALLAAKRKIITTIQAVDYGEGKTLGIWRLDKRSGQYKRIKPEELEGMPKVFEVGVIGGTWLISREIAAKGLRYEYVEGKAEQVCFCDRLNKAGYKIYALRDRVAEHRMSDNLGDYKNS